MHDVPQEDRNGLRVSLPVPNHTLEPTNPSDRELARARQDSPLTQDLAVTQRYGVGSLPIRRRAFYQDSKVPDDDRVDTSVLRWGEYKRLEPREALLHDRAKVKFPLKTTKTPFMP